MDRFLPELCRDCHPLRSSASRQFYPSINCHIHYFRITESLMICSIYTSWIRRSISACWHILRIQKPCDSALLNCGNVHENGNACCVHFDFHEHYHNSPQASTMLYSVALECRIYHNWPQLDSNWFTDGIQLLSAHDSLQNSCMLNKQIELTFRMYPI